MTAPLYRRHDIWRRLSDARAVRYLCFEDLGLGLFHVHSADFFHRPREPDRHSQHESQAVELFIETDPRRRSKGFKSLQEAIEAHDKDFEN